MDPKGRRAWWDNLIGIDDPHGHSYALEYGPDGDWSQLTKLTQDFGDDQPDAVTRFDYTPDGDVGLGCDDDALGRTVATNVLHDETTYCYDVQGHVTQKGADDPGTGGAAPTSWKGSRSATRRSASTSGPATSSRRGPTPTRSRAAPTTST